MDRERKVMEKKQNEMRRRISKEKQKKYFRKRLGTTLALLVVITGIGLTAAVVAANKKKDKPKKDGTVETIADPAVSETPQPKEPDKGQEQPKEPEQQAASWDTVLQEANLLAAGYDYDGAIEKVKSYAGYESIGELTAAVEGYEATKAE